MELYANNTGPDFSTIKDPIEQLIVLSQFYGGDPRFVIAGGGNTSVKVRDRLFVKASGITLSGIEAEEGEGFGAAPGSSSCSICQPGYWYVLICKFNYKINEYIFGT